MVIDGHEYATRLHMLHKYKRENETLREMLKEREEFIQKLYDANLELAYKVQSILNAVDNWN
jgi:hypothetical protein